MSKKYLPTPASLLPAHLPNLKGGRLVRVVGSGKNGIVFEATRNLARHEGRVAVKLIPLDNLRKGWEEEVRKPLLLPPAVSVLRPFDVDTIIHDQEAYACLILPWINGLNLRQYVVQKPERVTHVFCHALARELLSLLHAMESQKIEHNDIKLDNLLVEFSNDSYGDDQEHFWLTDFGVGGSANDLPPQDDFHKAADVLAAVLKVAHRNAADGASRCILDRIESWLLPRLRGANATAADYRHARDFRIYIESLPSLCRDGGPSKPPDRLESPFDYLSCEQIGDKYGLLVRLASHGLPALATFLDGENTVLTGPRGCGKTTILRSLATKHLALAGTSLTQPLREFCIYYHCTDLFYAFPYVRGPLSDLLLRGTAHYFNLSLLAEVLDTLDVLSRLPSPLWQPQDLRPLTAWLATQSDGLRTGAATIDLEPVRAVRAQVGSLRKQTKRLLDGNHPIPSEHLLALDFIPDLFNALRELLPALASARAFVLLDDYSSPRVAEHLQASLNRVVFQRTPELFFKVSTESILTLNPFDSDDKLLERAREFTVIDLGTIFMNAEPEDKARFIEQVIDTRFAEAEKYKIPPLRQLLGERQEKSYVDIARKLRDGDTYHFHGTDTLVDMCSGDITHMLHLVRAMIMETGGLERFGPTAVPAAALPLPKVNQHAAIQRLGADFLSDLESVPRVGPQMAEVIRAFGDIAHWELMMLDSPNETSNPPKQSFRIEMKDSLAFGPEEVDLRELYEALIRYGVFIRDSRGKSLRSAVVPRLYLRRLLIPKFRLTFSKRDNVGMEIREFKELLRNPHGLSNAWPRRRPPSPDQLSLLLDK